ncbi:phage baseplate assembly protein V [Pseudomonas sp. SbB1]|uniref:Phage baseplate assembly protein V n=1 Tax=Pseudomonas putida (strain GB-1) TaxID=76869 RepID=B0KSZ4_PSEPG|nr:MULTISPECIES: phage baseplate assembly protein V [Pseudomonas]ABY97112.1 phage baseplate assembly protein V [Pseudomonas putida GB-1]MBP0707715.1 phage baseplate assembly protein V [Pseudomonas sp. T34]MCK2187156.1 phage baseplate assembly protein V [Pseudomonas sp. MB04B]MDD2085593.1 phage baseplate assembly protein V [Pseudomonas putida]MDD2095920.1 phage baseplate assembly protein V [Pseudomonas putida]
MSYAAAQADRMLAGLLIPCYVVGVDLVAARVRVSDGGDWTSAWVRWHAQAAGKARHWRAPSVGEQGVLVSPSGEPAQGTFIPGLYGNAGAPPDNRDHVEVWRFDDGGSLVYDWAANSYTIKLPSGTVNIEVGSSKAVITDAAINAESAAITAKAATITLQGAVEIVGPLRVTGDILGLGKIIDTAGNTANHKH